MQSIDSILASAAAAGITVASGPGDTGNTCLDGSKNVAAVPANCPHITAWHLVHQACSARTARIADATGTATISYSERFTSTDDVYAVANFGNGRELASDHFNVTWTPGKHTTLLSLSSGLEIGAPNKSTTFSADLVDTSVSPSAAASGVNVSFGLAGQKCDGTSDANAHVSCSVTASSAEGSYNLTATFAGSDSLLASSQTTTFELVNPAPGNYTAVVRGKDNSTGIGLVEVYNLQ